MQIQEKIKEIIVEVLEGKVEVQDIDDETLLTQDLGVDSIKLVSIIVELENKFDIEIEAEDLDVNKLTIFKFLCTMVENKLRIQDE